MSDDFLNKDEGAERLEGESGLSIEGTSSSDVYPNAEVRIIPAQDSVTHINRLCEIFSEERCVERNAKGGTGRVNPDGDSNTCDISFRI